MRKRWVGLVAVLASGCSLAPVPSPSPTTDAPGPQASYEVGFAPFGTVELEPAFFVEGVGDNIDTLAFWEADDPSQTLMFVTAKDNQLVEVWRYPFAAELEPLRNAAFRLDSQVNGVIVDQTEDLLYVSVSSPSSTVSVFALPSLEHETDLVSASRDLSNETNLGLLHHPSGTRLYVTADFKVYVLDTASGEIMDAFEPATEIETIVGDSHHQLLYIPDENGRTGVYVHKPNGTPKSGWVTDFGSTDFQADAEGILVYTCLEDGRSDDGRGFVVVADQRQQQTEFEFYDRQTWAHLGGVRLLGVSNTDGIGSTQPPLPDYPLGLFAAVDDDRRVAGIGWHDIFAATGLSC